MRNRRFLLLIGLLVLVIGGGIGWQLTHRPAKGSLAAYDFTLDRLDADGTLRLSDYRGQVVVLNFWASWCEPCKEEAPQLRRISESYAGEDVQFIGIATDDEWEPAQGFLAEYDIPYPNVFDKGDEIAHRYNVYAIPVTVVIDRDGKIIRAFFNFPGEYWLRQEIDQALG